MRVDAPHVVRERLRAQIGGGVDENRADRTPQTAIRADVSPSLVSSMRIEGRDAAVARIARVADGAVAADHRHAVRRAAAEDGDLKVQ